MKENIHRILILSLFALIAGSRPVRADDLRPDARTTARDADWGKLNHLLGFSAVSENAKTRWSVDFLAAYWNSPGIEPAMAAALAPHLTDRAPRAALEAWALEGKAGIQWVRIPGGTFTMGSDDPRLSDARPAHRVTVSSFRLSKTLVTNKQYAACVAAGACTPAHYSDGACPSVVEGNRVSLQGAEHPAVCVDRGQATAFSEWAGGRLPSEAEWEYAARGGGKDKKYPWGGEEATCARAAIAGCGRATAPVCSKPAGDTPQGLCDMAGNAWEWVKDSYHGTYDGAPADGSAWEAPGPGWIARGGSWIADGRDAMAAFRFTVESDAPSPFIGFRVADPPEAPWVLDDFLASHRLNARDFGEFHAAFELDESTTAEPSEKARSWRRLGADVPACADMAAKRASHWEAVAREALEARALTGKAGIRWVKIPGGTFTMGTADPELPDSHPPHSVTVKPFLMSKTLVTNKQYNACAAAGACAPSHIFDGRCTIIEQDGRSPGRGDSFSGDDQPVVCVSWEQAKAFAAWAGGRLPSEAEWEYAARGGGKGREYPWGDEEPTCARGVFARCGRATAPVCSKPAGNTPQGLCDMAGDAWELVEDWYHGDYEGAPKDGAARDDWGIARVARGGSWRNAAQDARSAARMNPPASTTFPNYHVGFRVAGPAETSVSNDVEGDAAGRVRARDTDWEKLSHLMSLTVIPKSEVRSAAVKFLADYWRSPGLEPSMAAALAERVTYRASDKTMRAALEERGLVGKAGIQWVKIPAGEFRMGSDDPDLADARPRHVARLKPFQIAKTPVTNKQYRACVSAGACTPAQRFGSAFEGDDQPVVGVDWDQAETFSKWAGGSLPSETQWEYAARGAGEDAKYPWGQEDPTCRTDAIAGCGDAAAVPVCTRGGETQQGLCDMAGGAREWVRDWYHDSYEGAPAIGAAWERPEGKRRVIRGASWRDGAGAARSAHRGSGDPGSGADDLSFRPVR
ncbi:MAG: formylglycine-generating enzyme family protein [Elusimicrobiota bacterium]